jgi:hypothetical protein
MIQKIRTMLASTAMLLLMLTPALALAVSVSAQADIQDAVCQGGDKLVIPPGGTVADGTCQRIAGGQDQGFNALLTKIINIISVIVGVVAVIMIIYGGFRYLTSAGSAEKVTAAKNTILYGLIGLIIVALAQVIVRFVLKNVTNT